MAGVKGVNFVYTAQLPGHFVLELSKLVLD